MNAVYAVFMFLALVVLAVLVGVLLWILERERHDRRRVTETLLNALNTDTTGEFITAEANRQRAEVALERSGPLDPLTEEFFAHEARGKRQQAGWPPEDAAIIGIGRGL